MARCPAFFVKTIYSTCGSSAERRTEYNDASQGRTIIQRADRNNSIGSFTHIYRKRMLTFTDPYARVRASRREPLRPDLSK